MNTSFAGNQVGGIVSLDVINSYPTGLLAQLGPYYNDSQILINAQLTYTGNQADISTEQNAGYAIQNIELEKSGTLPPNSEQAVSAASIYTNAANGVNYENQNKATLVNTEYSNAHAIEKACRDASYSAFLTTEASQVRLDRISTFSTVVQLGNTPITINPLSMMFPSTISTMVSNVKQTSQQAVADASGNVQAYITNTQTLLNNAITKSNSVVANRNLVAAFNTLVKTLAQAISFPLLEIASKETLVTQYVPSIILTIAIQLANNTNTFLNTLINGTITTEVTAVSSYADTLDSIARSRELNMYRQNTIQNNLRKAASSTPRYNTPTSNNPFSAYNIVTQDVRISAANAAAVERLKIAVLTDASGSIVATSSAIAAISAVAAAISPFEATTLALNASKSSQNARAVSNAINTLNTAYINTSIKEPIIRITALESISTIVSMISTINKVTSNSSAHSTLPITRRASNIILGIVSSITEIERNSLETTEDARSVLTLLNFAYSIVPAISDTSEIQRKLWAINAATARAREVAEKINNKTILLNNTAHTLVTPQKIAVQTASANNAGALNINYISRLERNSRNVYAEPPQAYSGFKADIRAKTLNPVRPTLDELVYRNRIQPLTLDSLRSISAVDVRVAQEVQEISDKSGFSFRK